MESITAVRGNQELIMNLSANLPLASILDVYTENSLRESIKPAWKYLLKFLYKQYPIVMDNVCKYSDEVYYILLFLLEENSLRRNGATITESFYSICRQLDKNDKRSGNYMKWVSLASVILLPYIVDKMEKKYDDIVMKFITTPNQITRIDYVIYKYYPVLRTFVKWLRIINYFSYIIGKTKHASPVLSFTKIQLVYGNSMGANVKNNPSDQNRSLLVKVLRFLPDAIASLMLRMAPFFFYAIQFLDTFYQNEGVVSSLSKSFEFKKPPPEAKVVSARLPNSKELCPICHSKHVTPTTTSVSGFVFCFECIFDYVQQYRCCPITYRQCNIENLVRLRV